MKKPIKILITLLVAITMLFGVVSFSACDSIGSIAAPQNFNIEWGFLRWTSANSAESNRVYIKRALSNEFVFLREVTAEGHGHCCEITDAISLRELDLEVGENVVRVISIAHNYCTETWEITRTRTSRAATKTIHIDIIERQQAEPISNTDFSVFGDEIMFNGNVIVYFRHPDEDEFVRLNGFVDHGAFFGTLPELRIGNSELKVINPGLTARLENRTLIIYDDSEPVFIPFNLENFETRQVPNPTNFRVVGSGAEARLHWDVAEDVTGSTVFVMHPYSIDFDYSAQAFNNSTQLNWLDLRLGDNEIKVFTHGRGTIKEGDSLVTYVLGYAIYTFTVHHERQVATPSNFRIEDVFGTPSLVWNRDPATNGNCISSINTRIEIRFPNQDQFVNAPFSGAMWSFSVQGPLLQVGENIIKIRVHTNNVSVINGINTRYTTSEAGYVTLIRDSRGNVSIE